MKQWSRSFRIQANFENISVLIWRSFGRDFYICCTSMSYASNRTRIASFQGSYAELLIFSQICSKLKSWERQNRELTLKRYHHQSTKSLAVIFTYYVVLRVVFPTEKENQGWVLFLKDQADCNCSFIWERTGAKYVFTEVGKGLLWCQSLQARWNTVTLSLFIAKTQG